MVSARSGRPTMNPSDRPVSSTPVPLASMAARAARIRSTASSESNSGVGGVAGRILDRDAGDPGAHRPGHVGRDAVGLDGEATFEIGVDRHLSARGDRAEVGQHLVEGDRVVGPAERPGEPRACRRERLEAESRERAGAADIPRIGDDEAAARMEIAERGDPICLTGHRPTIPGIAVDAAPLERDRAHHTVLLRGRPAGG